MSLSLHPFGVPSGLRQCRQGGGYTGGGRERGILCSTKYSLGGCRGQVVTRSISEAAAHLGRKASEAMGTYTHYCPLCNTARVDWVCTQCGGCEDCCGCGEPRSNLVSRAGREGAVAVRRAVAARDDARARTTKRSTESEDDEGSGSGSEPRSRDPNQLSWLMPDQMRIFMRDV